MSEHASLFSFRPQTWEATCHFCGGQARPFAALAAHFVTPLTELSLGAVNVDKVDKSLLGADFDLARRELRESTQNIVLTNLASRRTRACWWLSQRLGGRSVFGRLYKQTVTKPADPPITRKRPRDVGTPGAVT